MTVSCPYRMSASVHFVGALAEALEAFDFPMGKVLAICGTSPLEINRKPTSRVPISRLRDMFKAAETALNDPQIGLRAGHRFRIAKYGRTGAIYAYADNLEDVINLNAKYQRLAIDIGDIGYEQGDDLHAISFKPYYEDLEAYRHVSAMLMGAYATAFRWLSWTAGQGLLRIELPYAEPETGEDAEAIVGCPVTYGHSTGRLILSPSAMAEDLPMSDPEKRAWAVAVLDSMMGSTESLTSFQNAVHEAMRAGLDAGGLNAAALATRMALTESELRKKMKMSGLTYRTELDTVRQEILIELVRLGESFSQIAVALGYNDQAAFNRAFRRWYGVAPGQWTPPDDLG